jgi:hypothetical protein
MEIQKVIRDELRALVSLAVADTNRAHGYALAGVAFAAAVELTLAKQSENFVVWIVPADETGRCYRRTQRFNIGHRGDPPDRAGYTAIDLLCQRLRDWEEALGPGDLDELFAAPAPSAAAEQADWLPDLEWRAVRSGLKPASRNVASSARLDVVLAEARRRGLHAEATRAGRFVAGFCAGNEGMDAIVYTARDPTALAAAVAAESVLIDVDAQRRRAPDDLIRRLGAALGYPPCCVEAFLPVRDLNNGQIRFHALGRTTGTPDVLLNDTIEGRVVVSHAVCRYDCAASASYARALLADLARDTPEGAARLERSLRGLVLLFANGAVLRLEPSDTPGSGDLFAFDAVEERGDGEPFATWRAALRGADALRIDGSTLHLSKGGRETQRLFLDPTAVRMGLFR